MKYIFFYLFLNSLYLCGQQTAGPKHCLTRTRSYAKTLTEPQLSETEKISRQLQLDTIASKLILDLLAFAKPEQIQIYLDQWENLKSTELIMQSNTIDRIKVTACTVQELAKVAACEYVKTAVVESKGELFKHNAKEVHPIIDNYINAQLNDIKIRNYLGS